MQGKTTSILQAINNTKKKYNILTFPTHESIQTLMAKTGHNFHLYQGKGIKTWDNKYRKLPDNHVLLSGEPTQIQPDLFYDFILSQNKAGQYPVAKQLSDSWNCPLITLEHTLPPPNWSDDQTKGYTSSLKGDINVYISKYSVNKWFDSFDDPRTRVIIHGMDTEFWKPLENGHNDGRVLTVANLYSERDWALDFQLYKRVCIDRKMPINPVGDTPGLSKAAKDEFDLLSKYQNASVFFNTSKVSPIPLSCVEAASCACPIVSTNTCLLPDVFTNNHDGFFSNDEQYLKDKLDWVLTHPEEAKELGKNARKTVLEKFNINRFVDDWNKIFDEAYGSTHYA